MTRYRATLAYDGSAYQGFQRQAAGVPTIQFALERAIARVTQQETTVIGAGRTDAGVHAAGQVIAFDVSWLRSDDELLRALNAVLPDDIALIDLVPQPGFHPRYDALSRLYRYVVVNAPRRQPLMRRYSWHVWGGVNLDQMHAAASLLVGRHDFATFGAPPRGENTVREVYRSEWAQHTQPYGRLLTYWIEANAFLQRMVRRIVGTLIDVGLGALAFDEFEAAFHAADLAKCGTCAPAQGLFLEQVRYPPAMA